MTFDRDQITGRIIIPSTTAELDPCEYIFKINGRIREGNVVGTYRMTAKASGGETTIHDGCFDGKWKAGMVSAPPQDSRPWWVPVPGFQPIQPGGHPRLLFRKLDLASLRRKAESPAGKAMIASLRRMLNGSDGESMPTSYSNAEKAYDKNANAQLPIGTYTIGHAAGYGLLYQLTGNKKYADLGKECFEVAMKGQRDRDDRYSWKDPCGALRAGPTLGWYAVGYDLC